MRLRALPALLVLVLAACKSVTDEDRTVASAYLENAAQYYDGGHWLRAYQQWGRALDLDPHEERAQLGQAMALLQMSRVGGKEGISFLQDAEKRLAALRNEIEQGWKADLGYAMVQQRWAELYDQVARLHERNEAEGAPFDGEKLAEARKQRPHRIALAERSFGDVLADPRSLPNFHLTAWLGLARLTAMRGAYEESLRWCRLYEEQVVRSREMWAKAGEAYASKLFGAELQEAELRDVLANTLFKLGRFDEAEKELDRLVALQPKRAEAYLNRAMLREARASWDLARSDYAHFVRLTELEPADPIVLEAEKRRLLCEERLAAEDAREQGSSDLPR